MNAAWRDAHDPKMGDLATGDERVADAHEVALEACGMHGNYGRRFGRSLEPDEGFADEPVKAMATDNVRVSSPNRGAAQDRRRMKRYAQG